MRRVLGGGRHRAAAMSLALPAQTSLFLGFGAIVATILVHEAGHFAAARALDVRVKEFSVGVGPKVFALPQLPQLPRQPQYTLRLLPLGGYVSFPQYVNVTKLEERGITIDRELSKDLQIQRDDPDLLENRPAVQQALVISGGVLANLMLAWSCFFMTSAVIGIPTTTQQQVMLSQIVPGSAAEATGLKAGDRLISINGRAVGQGEENLRESLMNLRGSLEAGRRFEAVVERSGSQISLGVQPLAKGETSLGVVLSPRAVHVERRRLPVVQAATQSAKAVMFELRTLSKDLASTLVKLCTGGSAPDVQGPLAIGLIGSSIASADPAKLVDFIALVSLNLAVVNSLPLPGLDGFLMLVLALQTAFRRKLPEDTRDIVNAAGSLFLLLVFSRVVMSDVLALVGAQPALASALGSAGLPSAVLGVLVIQQLSRRPPPDGHAGSVDAVQPRRSAFKVRWPWSSRSS